MDTPAGENRGGLRLVSNGRALALLLLVLVSLVGGAWLLAGAAAQGTGMPPPLLPFVLLFLAALGLIVGQEQERAVVPAGAEPARHPVWATLGLANLPAGVPPWRMAALLSAIIFTLIVLARLPAMSVTDNYLLVFLGWLAATILYIVAVHPPPRGLWGRWRAYLAGVWAQQRLAVLLLGGILLLAFLLRSVAIGTLPHTLSGDEGSQGLEALRVLNREIRNPFTTGWLGVPTMSFFFNSITIKLLGPTNAALRLPWAVVGTLTVAATFFLVKRLTNLPLALATTALVAVYHYHIHYSRLGSNQVADPLFVVLSLLFLYRALDEQRAFDWAMAGVTSALALYFYAGARFTPIIIIALLLYHFIRSPRRFGQEHVSGVVIMLGAFLVVGAPMLQYALRFPDDFNARLNQVGIVQSGWLANEVANTGRGLVEVLSDQFRRAFLAYNYYPDRTVWYGLREPLLDPVFGAIFLLGLFYGTLRLFGDERGQRLAPMVAWWWGGIILGGMLTESPPSTQRLITTSIPTCFFVALALWEILRLAETAIAGVPRRLLMALGVAVFAVISLQTYFVAFAPQRIYGGSHAELGTDLAPLLNALDETHEAFFVGAPWMYWGFGTIPYMVQEMPGRDILEPLTQPPAPDLLSPGRGGVFIFLPERANELALVQEAFPNGQLQELRATDTDGRLMALLYIVPPP